MTEICAGVLIGPQVLDLVDITAPLEVFAQLGLVFLFFLAGLEIAFRAEQERHLRLLLWAFALSLVLAFGAGFGLEAAGLVGSSVLVAIILAATSFGIVVAVLKDVGASRSSLGQLVIACASIADFGTVILLSIFFSHQSSSPESTIVLLLLFGGVVVAVGMLLAGARMSGPLVAAVVRMQRTSAQIGVRIAFLLVVLLVLMAQEFGLEVVLGAFLAGAMLSFLDREEAVRESGLQEKLEGIGFGVFIPIFFVVSGVQLQLDDLFSTVDAAVLVPLTVVALLVVRGTPALIYSRFMTRREAVATGLLQATSLSFIVAASQIGVELGKLEEVEAAGLVAGGVISVLVFPAIAVRMLRPAS